MGNTLISRLYGAPRTARRALSFPVLLLLALVGTACGDDTNVFGVASSENTTRVYSVWALTGTLPALPAAYQLSTESLARPQILSNGAVNFDLAFDLTAENKVSLLPVRVLVPLPPAGAPVIGVQRSTSGFATIEKAPDKNYVNDTTMVVGVGETLLYRLSGSGCIYGDPFYAKLVVDSIIARERRIVVRSLINRNCGFRALTEGLPKN